MEGEGNEGLSSLQRLVTEIKEEFFHSSGDLPCAHVSASAYDTAWVAMVPDPSHPGHPMFPTCLNWVLNNQKVGGFWGETVPGNLNLPTFDCLTATLACMVVLKVWNAGHDHVLRGLEFIHASMEKVLAKHCGNLPTWFSIVFPGMVDLAIRNGLDVFRDGIPDVVSNVISDRQGIIQRKEVYGQGLYAPLISHLEVLPETCERELDTRAILEHQRGDGSLFLSPAATAAAYMRTGDRRCMQYLERAVGSQEHENGVPSTYPVDEVLAKMCLVDWLERVGCGEHFAEEINHIVKLVYSDWSKQGGERSNDISKVALQLYKESLAFRLLRMHGYEVSPRRFCWFLHDNVLLHYIKDDPLYFLSAMFNIYKASHLAFLGESDLKEVGICAKQILENVKCNDNWKDGVVILANVRNQIEHELQHSWITRMDHLEHKHAIEISETSDLWVAKASFFSLACFNNKRLLKLAKNNFALRQSVFRDELKDLQRWGTEKGLSDIGFGREKTAYCYYLMSSNSYYLHLSEARKTVTKCAVLVTVADDFFDFEGTIEELHHLMEAVRRWDHEGLYGSSRIIFDALDGLVDDTAKKCFDATGQDVKEIFKDIWNQVFEAWLTEAKWSKSQHAPSLDEYLEVGINSIAIQAMALPACYLQCPEPPGYVGNDQYEDITLLTMISSRLLNDTQSYQKESEEGKLNMVLLYLKENPGFDINEALYQIKKILEIRKKQALKLILLNGPNGSKLPRAWKDVHLTMLKAFHMLFQSSNIYDSPTALVESINDAIYNPLSSVHVATGFRENCNVIVD